MEADTEGTSLTNLGDEMKIQYSGLACYVYTHLDQRMSQLFVSAVQPDILDKP